MITLAILSMTVFVLALSVMALAYASYLTQKRIDALRDRNALQFARFDKVLNEIEDSLRVIAGKGA